MPDDLESLARALSPRHAKRVASLRRHEQLRGTADELEHWLGNLPRQGQPAFVATLLAAEMKALCLDAAPLVREKRRRQDSSTVLSDADILAAVAQQSTKKAAAADLGIDARHLRRRLAAIRKRTS
ncbi:MAG: hypothetical protein WD793_10870 [Steroidobacteraceae bacterium]